MGQYHFGIAICMWHDIHPYRFSNEVQDIDDHFQLFIYRIEGWKIRLKHIAPEFRINIPAGGAIQTGHYTRLPDRQNMYSIKGPG